MIFTNKLNISESLVNAIKKDSYSKGDSDFSVTGLINPARIEALRVKHDSQIKEDVSDRIYSLLGQSIHTILERAALGDFADLDSARLSLVRLLASNQCPSENSIKEAMSTVVTYLTNLKDILLETLETLPEKRFYHTFNVPNYGKIVVSGQIDVYNKSTKLLEDYKVTSAFAVRELKEEHAKQMNMQRYLLNKNGIIVQRMQIVGILRDWSKLERARNVTQFGEVNANYPEHQIKMLEVPIIPDEEVEKFIIDRIVVHLKARQVELPQCSKEEKWQTDSKYALMKKGAKRAVKLFNTKQAAVGELTDTAADVKVYYIEERPSEAKRCMSYCSVSEFCDQFKNEKKGNNNNDEV